MSQSNIYIFNSGTADTKIHTQLEKVGSYPSFMRCETPNNKLYSLGHKCHVDTFWIEKQSIKK